VSQASNYIPTMSSVTSVTAHLRIVPVIWAAHPVQYVQYTSTWFD